MLRTAVPGLSAPARKADGKITSAREAVSLIRSGDTIATSGFVGIGFAEAIAIALEERFLDSARQSGIGEPRGLSLVYAAGQGDGKLKARTTADLVCIMAVDGAEYLFYRTFPINIGIVRGTTADPDGNVTMEREALTLEALSIAMAAHNCGGRVIVQVERIAER